MYTASIMSRSSMVSTMIQSIQATKPAITIKLKSDSEYAYGDERRVRSIGFTTRDKIEGEVSFVSSSDIRFDEIYIGFEGNARVWMERYGAGPGGPMSTMRTFLKLSQPVEESTLPVPRIAEKGRTYTFPFVFVVPDRLLPTMCEHHYKNTTVEEAHMRLPPSLGDGTAPAYGGCTYDDIAPDMSRISYAIVVKILKRRDSDNRVVTVAEESRRVRILPIYEDLPPAMVDDNDKDLSLRKERTIRKGFLKGKLGKLVVEATQPSALRTLNSQFTSAAACPSTTMVPVTATFYPADPSLDPPALNSLTTKLRVYTFFSTSPISYFPTPSALILDGALGRYHEAVFVGAQNLGSVRWEKHSGTPGANAPVHYTTNLTIPLVMPKYKYLVPSFHSCLVSRTYTVEVHLDVHTPGYNIGTHPGLTLKIPLQVSSPAPATIPTSGAQGEDISAEDIETEFFTPRSVAPPEGIPILSDLGFLRRTSEEGNDGGRGEEVGVTEHPLPSFMRINRPNMRPPPGYTYFLGACAPVRIPSPVGVSPGCG
ncbi:hypothetical protein BDZ91DRAFT_193482 [Kalaharituber pfeilii]|nr:hypothetical protein BDZ91DRAFT_193482 [Kalaharituber pfeilii]